MYTQYLIDVDNFKRALHPAYSPDIAPSDFFLFGYIKEKLRGQLFTKRDELLDEIYTKIYEIPHPLERKVFNEWKSRSPRKMDYISQAKSIFSFRFFQLSIQRKSPRICRSPYISTISFELLFVALIVQLL